ncbi:MAG TPA: LysR family transcriptional regulator [Rickettsiales bacterium]|nr:LysR family transcriptional regulator [Rickettsiales bacterium]
MEEKIYQILYKRNIIQPLKGVLKTIEEGSVVKASEKLNRTQATVTRQIQSLERDLGEELFDRSGKNLIPNEKGLRFYDMAVKRLEAMETLFADFLTGEKIEDDNTIRVAAHYGIITEILPNKIKEFQEKNENIKVIIYNINREKALKLLENNEIDMAVYSRTSYPKCLQYTKFFETKPILIVSENNPLALKKPDEITLNDVDNSTFINLNENMVYDFMKDTLKKNKKYDSKLNLIDGDWSILLKMVGANLGISGIFDFYNNETNPNIVSKDISHIFPNLIFDILTKRSEFKKSSLNKFINFMKIN